MQGVLEVERKILDQQETVVCKLAKRLVWNQLKSCRSQSIQAAVNAAGPAINILDASEEARIREPIALELWPNGWDADDPAADSVMETIYQNGAVQPLLFGGQSRVKKCC